METDLLKEWFQRKQDPDFYPSKKKKDPNPKSSYLCNEKDKLINQFSGQRKSSWIELDQWKLQGSFMGFKMGPGSKWEIM